MPVGDTLFRIFREALVTVGDGRFDPTGLVIQHQVRVFRWGGQVCIDRRCVRVYKIRPTRIPKPKGTAACPAEATTCLAFSDNVTGIIPLHSVIDSNVILARYMQRLKVGTQVNGRSTSAGCLAAN